MGESFFSGMANQYISNPNEGSGQKAAQVGLPILGQIVGSFFGPIGGMVGKQAGRSAGNLFATGDLAGAAPGTWASDVSNMGGLFQGQGMRGFMQYLLQNVEDPESAMTMLQATQGPEGQGYTTAPEEPTTSSSEPTI